MKSGAAKAKMTQKDVVAASSALVDWLHNQEIPIEDAASVLTTVLVAVIAGLAVKYQRDAKVGGELIAKMIVEAFDD